MTRELIIEGQRVDLAPDTDITLEYRSSIIGDIGKINLSRSYTIRVPRTLRNARILDSPGSLGHSTTGVRRFLSANFIRNGIDLIGDARAYILKTSPDSYEIALVWNTLESLHALSQSSATLNDLEDLPTLTWIGPNGLTPDYTQGTGDACFAYYNSGLGAALYPDVKTATHPWMSVRGLLNSILAGVPHELTEGAQYAISNMGILAAPGHKPSRQMEIESGSRTSSVRLEVWTENLKEVTMLVMDSWVHGWDAPSDVTGITSVFYPEGSDSVRVLLNLRAPSDVEMSGVAIVISGSSGEGIETQSEELHRAYFESDESGWFLFLDEEIKAAGWPRITIGVNSPDLITATFTAYEEELPLASINRVHEAIDITQSNTFPIQGNLPDIKNWDFVKACMVMFGLVPIISIGKLKLATYDEVLTTDNAYDWTAKIDMSDGGPEEIYYTLDEWAQLNAITYLEDTPLDSDPDAILRVEDSTLPEHRDMYELPFAASQQNNAVHYKILEDGTVEDVDIEPRIFHRTLGIKGLMLFFEDNMKGDGLINARYKRFQEIIRKPVRLVVKARLNELDIAGLDFSRLVYLEQFGHYYAILKIQTSNTDMCKVELLQIP